MTSQAKKDLRKQIKSHLSTLIPQELTTQSQKAQNTIISLPKYQSANRISIYLSMPQGEARTDILVHDALSKGKKVFVPYIHRPPAPAGQGKQRGKIEMLRLHSLSDYDNLEHDTWGIPSLPSSSVSERENAAGGTGLSEMKGQDEDDPDPGRGVEGKLDLVVMPGVAFDEGCNRLGHGGGFYDGFLERFCGDGTGKPYLVGLCLKEQLLPPGQEIPTTEDDWIVDAVAVGDGRLLTLDD